MLRPFFILRSEASHYSKLNHSGRGFIFDKHYMSKHPAYEAIRAQLPKQPGVYRYYNVESVVIYVGKAKNLKNRVASYFTKSHDTRKTRVLVRKIERIEFTIVETEHDALLLENALIKKYQPRYNILLKDDKSFPYICIKNERFPRVFLTRQVIKDGSTYLGPFTSIKKTRFILEFLKRLFPLRTCNFNLSESNISKGKFQHCLEYDLGNCLGPCEGLESEEHYMENINQLKSILRGRYGSVSRFIKERMMLASDEYRFEDAAQWKNKLDILQNYQGKSTVVNVGIDNVDVFGYTFDQDNVYISFLKVMNGTIVQVKMTELKNKLEKTQEEILSNAILDIREIVKSNSEELILPFHPEFIDPGLKVTLPQRGDKKKLLDLATKNADYYRKQREEAKRMKKTAGERALELLTEVKKNFRLTEIPRHIECFDNSNFQGAYPVASMVLFRDGKPSKKEYRHFKIKTVVGSDDFASMKEIVFRRYKRLVEEEKELPQLIIVDGGKGQLNAGLQALDELGLRGKIAIAGIAKRLEEIYLPNDPVPLYIDKRSQSLKLIQQLRNEAHRFAINFHRKLRKKGTLKSELEEITGIGKTTAEKLLRKLKSMKKVRESSIEELEALLDKRKAKAVFDYFHNEESDLMK